jgi:uncharacterized phage-associated protein
MTDIKFRFNFQKALQATAWLLQLAGGRMHYLKLLKLLYIAEREYLVEESEMIFGDRVVAMKYGPVLSNIFDLIKSEGDYAETWREYIRNAGRFRVVLHRDPGFGDLCRAERRKLEEVYRRYGHLDRFLVSEMTHDFPEWAHKFDTHSSRRSFPISVEEILAAQGKEELIGKVRERQAEIAWCESLFGVQS